MAEKTRLRMTIAYDGTDFCGWQKQTHEQRPSIQSIFENAFSSVFNEEIKVTASGRTDAGVHAKAQTIHLDVHKPAEAFQKWDLPWAVKRFLPDGVSIKRLWVAPPDFHALLSSTHKTYKYYIWHHPRRPAFLSRYSHWLRRDLDLNLMNTYSQKLLGEHDFKAFQSVGTPLHHTVRTMHQARWTRLKPHLIEFEVTASGFLKQMVRNIVGTQLLLEKTSQDPLAFEEILRGLDRQRAGPPAEPQGLFLHRVYYPSRLDKQCREI